MKKRFQKVVVLALVGIMTMSVFSGCGKKNPTENPGTTTAPTKAGEATETPDNTVAGIEGWTPFSEKVSITVPVYDRSKEGYPAVDDNYWTKWIQKEFGDKYNVDVDFVAIPRGDVMTKYSMLIAAEQTPTILMEYDYPKVAQWANDGAMQVIDLEKFKQVAPNYYQKMVDNNQLDYTKINGEDYFVLSERPYYNTPFSHVRFVRKDWLDKVGKEVPQNYQEYTEAIDAIIAAGLTDQPPVDLSLPTAAYVPNFGFRNFPVDEKEWAMHSSLGTASLSWEPTYKLLKRQNAEYNKGYFSKEYDLDANVADSSQAKTDFINGKLFTFAGYMSASVDWLTAFYEKNPGAELAIASVTAPVEPGVVDVPGIRADNPFGMIVGFSSLATEDQLKAAWMYMEWMSQEDVLFTLENGVEGVTYTLDENGLPKMDDTYRGEEMLNHNNNIDMTCIVHATKQLGTIEDTIKALTPQGLPQDFYQAFLDNYKSMEENKKYAYSDPVFSVPVDAESEYSAALFSLYQEYSVQLTKCKPEEFDALYEKLSKQYLDAGYQEIIDERLEAYEAGNTTKLILSE
ncbi:putative ABC transporter peptide-binding protein YtcQ [Anaerocolumna cellulosilytica]|uniref:Putative ABC transporter peptide-binding protein YtcQ n=1 Tax=Anaerocolumna cellulosilytica TaxID=433286 RepID=A0A6S6RBN8_9FIRM|nr:extracellular solute-binding protein [Anaerocolumna cellulosilytica]MBB5197800.1 putative aldouronate transport system substrate-binding protein [Anaerocolumna cellulosilytica]BCJ96435.1 putative ABC transporter peptide-binding protein YtcQ [Anaerocolumna cellulosilytica]